MSEKAKRRELSEGSRPVVQPVGEKNGDCVAGGFVGYESKALDREDLESSLRFFFEFISFLSPFRWLMFVDWIKFNFGDDVTVVSPAYGSIEISRGPVWFGFEFESGLPESSKWTDHGHSKSKPRSSK